jgi:ferrous iron transport protein B
MSVVDQEPIVEGADANAGDGSVLLVGNPNVGKSVLFSNLTSHYVTVSNYPGTTVEVVRAKARGVGSELEIVDCPGVNDLSPRSEDARVTRQLLDETSGATVVQVADAKNLRRSLLLTLQLADLDRPMVLVLNMADELASRGGKIDQEKLQEILGIPVVSAVAVANRGTEELMAALENAAVPRLNGAGAAGLIDEYERNKALLARVNEVLEETYSMVQPQRASLGVRMGFWAMHPIKGLVFMVAALAVVFWFVGLLGAGTLVDLLENGVFGQWLSPAAIGVVDTVMPFPHHHLTGPVEATVGLPVSPVHEVTLTSFERTVAGTDYVVDGELSGFANVFRFFHDFLVGEFGAITMALSYAFAIVLPIVTTFFLLFSILEDSGYLPRMAIMVNRLFRIMGLNGKAVLPMILGLGCDTMATMTTRILETRKERIVTTMLLALAVPCSAQLGVLLAMMANLSFAGAIFWLVLMTLILLVVGWLTARVFDGDVSEFILEIPPMRRPQLRNVWIKTVSRVNWYLIEVIPLFVVGTGVLFLFDRLGLLARLARLGEPIVKGWLGLPTELSNAFIVGFMRRDFGAIYILDAATGGDPILTSHQILVAMVTITLFMPCFANFLMIAKEHGQKVAWSMLAFIFPFAFLVGGLVHHIGQWLFGT